MNYTETDVKNIMDITKKYEATENGYPLMLFLGNLSALFVCIHLLHLFSFKTPIL